MKKSMPFEPFRTATQPVNVKDLERFDAGSEVTLALLSSAGLAKKRDVPVKILAKGEISKALPSTRMRSAEQPGRRSRLPAGPASSSSPNTEGSGAA